MQFSRKLTLYFVRTLAWNVRIIFLLLFGTYSTGFATADIVLYPPNPDHKTDGVISGSIEGRDACFEYQHTYHFSSKREKDFKANYVRFAAEGEIRVNLHVRARITKAHLRSLGKDLPFSRQGSHFQFTLPGPGNYYLQLPDLNTPGRITYTVFFFVDELAQYKQYQQQFAESINVLDHGVVSSSTEDQTSQIQTLIDQRDTVFFPGGIYRTGMLTIPSDTRIYLEEGAVLKGTDDYNGSRYIHIENGRNIRIAGLGTIDANGNLPGNRPTKGHLIDIENCDNVRLDGLMFRNSNSWMLHIRRSQNIDFRGLHLFSGKDGIDPDGSTDVMIQNVTIQSIDDAFAVKSKFKGNSCERVTMKDCIVFSCASSLKVGTENYYGEIRDITWDNCDAVDADRGIILYTNEDGAAPICNIFWKNIRVFNFDWAVETGGAPFQFENRRGNTGGDITDIFVENVVAFPETDVDVDQEAGIVDVTFRNVIVHGTSQIEDTANMTFKGVIWDAVNSESMPIIFIEPCPHSKNKYRDGDSLVASVKHPDGCTITKVEWFIDNSSVGIDTSAPFTHKLSGLEDGEHIVYAKATDEGGKTNRTASKRIQFVYE